MSSPVCPTPEDRGQRGESVARLDSTAQNACHARTGAPKPESTRRSQRPSRETSRPIDSKAERTEAEEPNLKRKDHPMQHRPTIMRPKDPTRQTSLATSATRAQNPLNTTRTCNKLPSVNWLTGEAA